VAPRRPKNLMQIPDEKSEADKRHRNADEE
jgi:hypothetical protein